MGKKWIGIISSLMLVLAAVTGSVWSARAEDSVKTTQEQEESIGRQKVQMEYYQYNVCGSCHPEDDFYAIVTDMIRPLREEYPYEIMVYNTFRSYDREKFQKRLQELGLTEEETALPALIVGSSCLSGLDDIRAGIKNLLIDAANQEEDADRENGENDRAESGNIPEQETGMTTAADVQESPAADIGTDESREEAESWKEQLREAAAEDSEEESVIFYFSTVSCDDCNTVKEFLAKMAAEQEALSEKPSRSEILSEAQSETQAETLSVLKIHEFNIAEGDNVVLLQKLFEVYEVPSEEQQVPMVFFNGGYLSGAKAISGQLEGLWKQGKLTGFDLEALLASSGSAEEEKPLASLTSYLGLAATGFINGINPCGASMLLMLLAAMAMAGRSVIRVGCAYLAGKFAAYCAMGLGLYQLFLMIDQNILLSVSRVLTWVFAAVFLVLAVLYLIDFINVRKKEYGKIRMQLPQALRRWNHKRIEEASKAKGVWLIPAAFLLGIVISAGEFFCTGQVYLAAILYLMKMQREQQLQTAAAFLIYVAAMCIPSLLIVLVIEKTRNVIRMSNATVTWLPVIKLVTAVVFFLFAVLMILQ